MIARALEVREPMRSHVLAASTSLVLILSGHVVERPAVTDGVAEVGELAASRVQGRLRSEHALKG